MNIAVPKKIAQKAPFLSLALSLFFVAAVRYRLLGVPLERDEGGFAYAGRLMWTGGRLYQDVFDSKLPGLYGLYGFFVQCFGYSETGVHLGLACCNLTAILLFFLLSRRLFGGLTAALATPIFALSTLSINVLGFAAHANQLLLPFALGAFLCLENAINRQRRWTNYLLAGVLLGTSISIKQQALFFAPLAALFLFFRLREQKQIAAASSALAALCAGIILPYMLMAAWMGMSGRWADFQLWTSELPATLAVKEMTESRWVLFGKMFEVLTRGQELFWFLGGLGGILLWGSRLTFSLKFLATGWVALMFGGVLLGAGYYPHYYILMLPGLAICAALLVLTFETRHVWRVVATGAWFSIICQIFYTQKNYFFTQTETQIARAAYGANPFPESKVIGAEIKKRSRADDLIQIFGGEPEVLVYCGLRSATAHLYTYALLDGGAHNKAFKERVLQDFISKKPRFAVVFTGATSWLLKDPEQGNIFLGKLDGLLWDNPDFVRIGVVDIFSDKTIYRWDAEAATYQPRSEAQVWVYQRK